MTRKRAVFDSGRTRADRHRVSDLPVNAGLLRMVSRTTHASGAPQVRHQLLLQSAGWLYEQAAIDRLGGPPKGFVIGVGTLQPARRLLGRPLQAEFARHELGQPSVVHQFTDLRATASIP